jgi:hypothetical protein
MIASFKCTAATFRCKSACIHVHIREFLLLLLLLSDILAAYESWERIRLHSTGSSAVSECNSVMKGCSIDFGNRSPKHGSDAYLTSEFI